MERVGRYQIVGELGRGAMGVVYRAMDPTIGRIVALKTTRLDVDHIERDELLRRLRNEAHAAGQMNHPNIVTIHDAGEGDGLFYIAMEYLEGETLQSLMSAQHLLSTDWIVDIAKQVATGLDYAHSMRVVHRDIKPANIMITRQKVAKIMDFGISKSVGTLTRTGQVLGTPYYMSPEQVMGHSVDGRSDLFSFGVVLYEMATGARPFGGDTVATVIYKIINETPPPACELQCTVHPGLSGVITRCLEKKPDQRYQRGAELAADLENFFALQASVKSRTVTPPSGSIERTQAIRFEQAAAVAPKRSAETPTIALPAGARETRATGFQSASRTAQPAKWLGPRRRAIWVWSAALVLLTVVVVKGSRRHRSSNEQPPGGASIVVNIPANLGKRARHEVPEKHEWRVRAADGSASAAHPIPEKVQTPSPERTVAISFTSNPAGASIRLDGQSDPAWITPHTISDITPGAHRVEIAKQGYSPDIRDVDIGPRDSSFGVNLVPK